MERKSIGTFIAALRRASGMTQKELAEKLSVSDKAVSRWERDESLPDLLLLPVIADVFHITVDELLRGERKAQETLSEQEDTESAAETARLRKQTKRVLTVQMNRLRNRNCIALGVGMLGLLGAVICNFGMSQGFLAACIGGLCVGAAAVMTAFFAQGAWQAADDEDYDTQSVREYRVQVIKWCKWMAAALAGMLAVCLPMSLSALQSYGFRDVYLEAGAWMRYSVICLAIMETVVSAVFWYVNRKLEEKELLPKGTDVSLHGWCVGVLSATMVFTLLMMWIVPQFELYQIGSGTTYTSVEEFKQAMDALLLEEKESGRTDGAWSVVPFRSTGTEPVEIETTEVLLSKIYDQQGNVVLEYQKPVSIKKISYSVSDENVWFRVFNDADYRRITAARENIITLLTITLVLEPAIAYGVYAMVLRLHRKTK